MLKAGRAASRQVRNAEVGRIAARGTGPRIACCVPHSVSPVPHSISVPLHAWSSARYVIPLPEGHRFPIAKYALLRDRALAEGLVSPERMHEPARAAVDDLLRVHSERYVRSVSEGMLTAAEQRRIGFPWSAH